MTAHTALEHHYTHHHPPLSLRELEDLATAIDDALAVAQRKAES